MSDTQTNVEEVEELSEKEVSNAAVTRFFYGLGERLERLRIGVRAYRRHGYYIYKLEARIPTQRRHTYLILVKALTEEGPVIAFHASDDWVEGLLALGGVIRAGRLEWHKDEYPPEDWREMMAFMHKNTYYID